jgi:hypothetical protein
VLRRLRIVLPLIALAAAVFVEASLGAWAGSDPPANYEPGGLPASCATHPTGTECINAGVYYLDRARAQLGQPAYKLPAAFPSLTGAEQAFILTNLDRILYGLPPITGLTAALDSDASASGVLVGQDPAPSDPDQLEGWTANWAGGYYNVGLAYEGWMFDDGLGSPNILCTNNNTTGCWGHRHDVLYEFASGDVLAMGAAVGKGPSDVEGYAMLLAGGFPGYAPSYSYTWTQAVADGAGTNAYNPGVPQQPPPDCVVPKLKKKPLAAARRLLVGAHCGVGKIVKRTSAAKKGTVLAQGYRGGSRLPNGTKVNLLVSRGRG